MAEQESPRLEWHINSVAMMRTQGRFGRVGEAIDSDADFRPTIASRTFPPRRRLKASFADYAAALEVHFDPDEAEGCFSSRDVTPRGECDVLVVDNGRLRLNRIHSVDGYFEDVDWFASPERLERLSAYLIRIADAFGAFYGSCSLNQMLAQQVRLQAKNAHSWFGRLVRAGRVVEDPEREIRDVHWWNYFGPAFVERWGTRLDAIGVKRTRTPGGAIAIWATESPFVYDAKVRTVGGYAWKRPFYEALGGDVFMWEGQRERGPGEVVPSWGDHHRASGVDVAGLTGKERPVAKARLLPRVIVLPDAQPLQEPEDKLE